MRILRRGRFASHPDRGKTHQSVRLGPGRHRTPGDEVCVMELASMLAGEPFTDHPKAVCPTVSALLRAYNDALGPEERQDLYRYASESVGTRVDYELERRRARFALAWAKSREYGRRPRRWSLHRRKAQARGDSSPGDIADFVVESLAGGTPSSHAAMLRLLDWLIGMGSTDAAVARLPAEHGVEAPLERAGQDLAHRPLLEALH